MSSLPVVLVFAGHDPTGGAGFVADSEAIHALGGWALTVPTALTVQTTLDVQVVTPCPGEHIVAAAEALLSDFTVAAIKIGLIASIEALEAIAEICSRLPDVPVIIDPVLKAGGGYEFSSEALIVAFRRQLLPHASLLTPNLAELERLAPDQGRSAQRAKKLIHMGCAAVLATGTDVPGMAPADEIIHTLFTHREERAWCWPRLAGSYHGSGCTLASACAVELAKGNTLEEACTRAQHFTWQSLVRAHRLGYGQALPARYHVERDSVRN
ncbi:bifunctional hydroxymethylpyrimidine kinase/phosphomethylpyrimidine kinase [Phytohalomonas tamaricis]|uniref:bifunctional hydroxymethylpyrimidine kinase/phosphomethylpyrimidine kinase n=1 Tax=Phytohalomonas tamaricis TaxID=2081032 RepID=UPI000D0B5CD9|nr:hydroxymethylpyrimidine/phosphomethylpyrimidine kinase [Phytohalomonas tamaricis]